MAETKLDLTQYDFRRNLIVDQDNPILVMKAWRDHFSEPYSAQVGHAYLGRPNSEDALTWNLFRSLEKAGAEGYDVVAHFFGISPVQRLLFWGCDLEHQGEEQQALSILLRTIDGHRRGSMTEPDLVVISEAELLFVECKLNLGNGSPWRAQGEGAEKRREDYCRVIPHLADFPEWRNSYQLIRNYLYAVTLARQYGKQPKSCSLISEKNPEHLDLLEGIYEPFRQFDPQVVDPLRTWQRMVPTLEGSSLPEEIRRRLVEKLLQALNAAT